MEWLWIALSLLVIIVISSYAFIVSKGKKVMRLEDKPKSAPRIDRPDRSATGGATATLDRPATKAPPATPTEPTEPIEPADAAPPGAPGSLTPTDAEAEAELPEGVVVPDSPAGLDTAPPVEAPPVEPEPEPAPVLDAPPSTKSRMGRLRDRLARSNSAFGRGLLAVISKDEMEEEDWEDLEDSLLQADVGVAASTHIVEQLRTKSMAVGAGDSDSVKRLLADELVDALGEDMDRTLAATRADGSPAVVMVVGVNGTGKTTTCGKLARVLVGDGHTVLMGAADTFRAAAADQLATWGERVGVDVVRGPEKADPASVAFDAVKEGKARRIDTVLIDTAGRLHTKQGLMDELGKVKRVVEKHGPVDETLLVLDATTGQNGLVQARVFTDVVDVTGVVLTKLDGSAKGGIVIAVQKELGVPVKYVGIGEGKDDLIPFVPREFVDGLLQTAG
ncbi:signal recognition particle-docking protein FtsY [Blastococcus sp. Marseille-P5729]|uniref:signal recognition particle-docking protein FtsY n=1 Tax=Blastococcus sp. Marseille-P5729 TaxID=2086582 RepID=UPI000D0EC300|nr:signal recognition particle-docking protein FtsY [Blastococcus sp. Marseille-P5729]